MGCVVEFVNVRNWEFTTLVVTTKPVKAAFSLESKAATVQSAFVDTDEKSKTLRYKPVVV
jgi:hypothetical protein